MSAPDWDELRTRAADEAQLTLGFLVSELPPAWVATVKLGVGLEERGGRLVGRCPFHDDSEPSFSCYQGPDGKPRWGCWSCPGGGAHGDVLDLVARARRCGVSEAVAYARLWYREYEAGGGGQAAVMPAPPPRELAPGIERWFWTRPEGTGALMRVAEARGWRWWLKDEALISVVDAFRLREREDGALLIPHFTYDPADPALLKLAGLKHRAGAGPPIAVSGSRLRSWYGWWTPRDNQAVLRRPIVVEGESDAWCAWVAGLAPYALPAGAGSRPPVDQLPRDPRLVLALDGDHPGRAATERLAVELRQAYGIAPLDLRVAWDSDLATHGPAWLAEWLREAGG